MSNDNSEANENMEVPFPSEAELFAAGYVRILTDEDLLARGFVPIDFKNMPAVEDMTTELGHPFPQHHEIIKAGYIPISRRERRIQSRPRVGQMYRSEEHTSELQSLMRISYAVFCLKKKNITT